MPVFSGPDAIERAYQQLGASGQANDHHWIKFFETFALSADADKGPRRSLPERKMLRDAYHRRGSFGLPAGLNENVRCLLDRDGALHSVRELRASKFLEDDYPALAAALTQKGADIAFADVVEGSRSFLVALQLRRLSELCGVPRIHLGPSCPAPRWFRSVHETHVLSLFQQEDFAVAVRELAWSHHRQVPSFRTLQTGDLKRRLAAIRNVQFVSNINRVYSVAGTQASVPAEVALSRDGIAVLPARNMVELEHLLGYAFAEILGANRLADARTLAVSILPLIRCRTRGEMLAYLRRQGVIPPDWSDFETNVVEAEEGKEEAGDPTEEIVREIIGSLDSSRFSGSSPGLPTFRVSSNRSARGRD